MNPLLTSHLENETVNSEFPENGLLAGKQPHSGQCLKYLRRGRYVTVWSTASGDTTHSYRTAVTTDFCTRETLWLWSQPSPAPTETSALKVGEFLLLALAPLSQSGINTKVTTMTTASFKDCTRFRSWSVCTWISLVQAAVRTAYALLWRQLNNKTSLNNCYCYCENKCCVEDF